VHSGASMSLISPQFDKFLACGANRTSEFVCIPVRHILTCLIIVPCVRANHGIGTVGWIGGFAASPCCEQMPRSIISLTDGRVPNVR